MRRHLCKALAIFAVLAAIAIGAWLWIRPLRTEERVKSPVVAVDTKPVHSAVSDTPPVGLEEEVETTADEADVTDIAWDPDAIAKEVENVVFVKFPRIMERLQQLPAGAEGDEASQQEFMELDHEKREIIGRVMEGTRELCMRKEIGYVDLYARMLKESPYFKNDAACYLSEVHTPEALAVLGDVLAGSDVYGRSVAAQAITPYLLEQPTLDEEFRAAFRRMLSDDVSAGLYFEVEEGLRSVAFGEHEIDASEFAEKMRGQAVELLVHFDDVASFDLLLDMEEGKHSVRRLGGGTRELYRAFARWGARNPSGQLVQRLSSIVDSWIDIGERPMGQSSAGNPVGAAFVLATLGIHGKLEELRVQYNRSYDRAAATGYPPLDEAGMLLAVRDTRIVGTIIDWLAHPDGAVRDRAVGILMRASDQRIGDNGGLRGQGTPEDKARWADVQAKWREWWAAHGEEFARTNPFAPPVK